MFSNSLPDERIDLVGRDPARARCRDGSEQREKRSDPEAGEGRDECDRRIIQMPQTITDHHGEVLVSLGPWWSQVPLVDPEDRNEPSLLDGGGDLGVLLRHPFRPIKDDQHHITTFDSPQCPERTESLQGPLYLRAR